MGLSNFLVHSCDVQTQSQTKSGIGGAVQDYIAKASGLACNVQQLSADAMIQYGKEGYSVTHRFYFDADPNVTIKDRFAFGGEYFEVRRINNTVNLDRLWAVDAELHAVK